MGGTFSEVPPLLFMNRQRAITRVLPDVDDRPAGDAASGDGSEKAGRALSSAQKREMTDAMNRLGVSLMRTGMSEAEVQSAVASFGAKCGIPCDEYEPWQPYGGAQSFAELRQWRSASEQQWKVQDLLYEFESLTENIWSDDDMEVSAKAAAVKQLADELEGEIGRIETGQRSSEGGWAQRLREKFLPGTKRAEPEPAPQAEPQLGFAGAGSMTLFRDKSGAYRYIAVASNNRFDKDGECFPAKAHEEFCAWANASKQLPELWLWHVPGSRIGKADTTAFDADTGFRVTLGTIDKGMEHVAEALTKMSGLAMSHGYTYEVSDLVDGIYEHYRTFEESVLPSAKVAANIGTTFMALRQEGKHMLPKEQREFFVQAMGEDGTRGVEETLGTMQKDLDAAGIAFKAALVPAEKHEPEPTPPPTPEPAPTFHTGDTVPDPAAVADPAGAPADPEPTPEPIAADPAALAEGASSTDAIKAVLAETIGDALDKALSPVTEKLTAIDERMKAVEDELPALREAQGQTMADLIRPRQWDPSIKGASEDNKTVVGDRRGSRAMKEAAAAAAKADGEEALEGHAAYAAPLLHMVPAVNGFRGDPAGLSGQ